MTNREQTQCWGRAPERGTLPPHGDPRLLRMPSGAAGPKDGFAASLGEGAHAEPCQGSGGEGKAHRFPADFIELALDVPLNFHFL